MTTEGRVDVRKAPTSAIFSLHLPRQEGKCDWCGLPCDERTPVRKKLRPRHAACEAEWFITTRPERARWHVEKRDHGICAKCGEDWSQRVKFRPEYPNSIERGSAGIYAPEHRHWGPYNPIIWISLWHVDHKVPLWKVYHLPPLQRIEFFKLANLVTLCTPCHKHKTRKEAADRAKFDAQAEALLQITKPPKPGPWGSRPMKSGNRFPPKGSRPMGKRKNK